MRQNKWLIYRHGMCIHDRVYNRFHRQFKPDNQLRLYFIFQALFARAGDEFVFHERNTTTLI